LQCVRVCCSEMHAGCSSKGSACAARISWCLLQCDAGCCSILQPVAQKAHHALFKSHGVCCSVLQCAAVSCSVCCNYMTYPSDFTCIKYGCFRVWAFGLVLEYFHLPYLALLALLACWGISGLIGKTSSSTNGRWGGSLRASSEGVAHVGHA